MMRIKNILLLAGLSLLLIGAAFSGLRLAQLSTAQEKVKEDYSLANSATFGLFSIDQWRDRITAALNKQINGYHINNQQRKDLRQMVEKQLHGLVAQTVAEINRPQKSLGGKLKKLAFNVLTDSAELQAQVRPFAQTIVTKVSSPESEARLKNIAGSKVEQLTRQIYDSVSVANYVVTKYVYKKYSVNNPIAFNKCIHERLASIRTQLIRYVLIMLGCVLTALLLWAALRKAVQLQIPLFVFALLFALVLLVTGSLVPVIEVDAQVKSLKLQLIGQQIYFENQVLFYQSKSIWGIVKTLISQHKPDAVVVGSLIMLFVLVLPLLRLIAKGIYVLSSKKIARHPVIRYLTFELGKWDMADVMIVGMLMTYIGLNGILKSQLAGLNIDTSTLQVITSNGTSLQAGYYIFAGYVLFALMLSFILKKVSPHDQLK